MHLTSSSVEKFGEIFPWKNGLSKNKTELAARFCVFMRGFDSVLGNPTIFKKHYFRSRLAYMEEINPTFYGKL